ncbi:PCI-domain-containing protein [Gloeophyllum trabeum ATCC 11539]|uniref:PCI-domain-containing protein n=1 Tax=Gloeophyllum trabeum (strain ATCC 11539 / FP-39264 / Madison 617) TaxID=670483 RepID=S7PSH4_GLOTA|nr:PCI-domain-containing protein [Gloeophyllum trabeum ATCC 11539]EPQ50766.1 PCI-domain-containing protein [Gloeophyllum trabeum ATCC 11539]
MLDATEQAPSSSKAKKAPTPIVPVDENHPFDLETYIASYEGRVVVDRLVHIITLAPSIAPQALQLAVRHIQTLRDPTLYPVAVAAYDQAASLSPGQLPSASEVATINQKWVDETSAKNQSERMKLEVELKTYTNNMIKESIRMAHRDLGEFYRSVGEYGTALRHFTKSREFCTTNQHILEMCLSVLELLIEQRNYSHVPTYIFKAEAALDQAAAGGENPKGAVGTKSKATAEREKYQTKLDFALALSQLGQGMYEKAAHTFLKLGLPGKLGDWSGKLVASGDIAVYGTLCALASMSRSAIKSRVLENETFSVYIEQEPYVRDIVDAYMSNRFKAVLDLLEKYSTRHYLDLYLSSHVHDLTNLIRNRAIVLYFQPFSSIKLERMSSVFGWTVEEVERQVVALIQSGDIQARVDSQHKILKAKQVDPRAQLYAKALKAGSEMQSANRKLLLRMRLQQADLIVKQPKNQKQDSAAMASASQMSDYIQIGD